MPASFVQATNNSTSGGTIEATFSTAPTQNNLLVAFVSQQGSNTWTTQSGWNALTKQSSSDEGGFYWKIAGASESTLQSPCTTSHTGRNWTITILEYSGIASTGTLIAEGGTTDSAAAKAHTQTGVTSGESAIIVGAGFITTNELWSTQQVDASATGVTERSDIGIGSGGNQNGQNTFDKLGITTSTSHSITSTASASGNGGACIAIFKEAASGTTHTVDGSDAFGLTDSILREVTFNRTGTEAFGLQDAVRGTWEYDAATTWEAANSYTWDNFGVTSQNYNILDTDPLGLTDSAEIARTVNRSGSDSLGLTDSQQRNISFARSLSDALGLADSAINSLGYARLATDSLGLQDAVSVALNHARIGSDSLGLTDSVEVVKALTRHFTDSLGLADSATISWTDNQLRLDNFGLSDSASIDQSLVRADTLGLSESVLKGLEKSRADSLDFTDSITIEVGRQFSDAFGITDTASAVANFGRNGVDSFGITDSMVMDREQVRTEAFGLSDSVAMEQSKPFSDSLGLSDSATVSVPTVRNFADSLGMTDSASVILTERSLPVSLVDDARTAIGNMLGLTDAQVAVLSINDLLHKYWSADFPLAHTYDGSESTLTPVEAFSILDHKVEVGVTLHWLKDVTET